MKGKFIVFEGISGTGKETQAKMLAAHLSKHNIQAHIVYHPSAEGKHVITSWHDTRQIDAVTDVYLLLADRYDYVRRVIRPALARGEWVISLRSFLSALVYQGTTEQDRAWIQHEFERFELKADYVFYFQTTPHIALERVMKRHADTGEAIGRYETAELLEQKLTAYQHCLQHFPHITIDCSESIEEIHANIRSEIHL